MTLARSLVGYRSSIDSFTSRQPTRGLTFLQASSRLLLMPVRLDQDTAELKEAIAKDLAKDPPEELVEEEKTFRFHYAGRRGKIYEGTFTNKILSIAEVQAANVLQARLQGGMPETAIAEEIRDLNFMIARMEYSLIKRPEWAEDLRAIKDVSVITKLYAEVASHEAKFWGPEPDQA